MLKPTLRAVVLAVAIIASHAVAADAGIRIHDAYVRLAPPGAAATGAFMRIENIGQANRKLIKAESSAARTVELHTHINENGVMKMRAVPDIEIKAGGQTELKPGSYHVMLIGMTQTPKEGDTVAITLDFDNGHRQRIDAPVRAIHAESAAHGGMKH